MTNYRYVALALALALASFECECQLLTPAPAPQPKGESIINQFPLPLYLANYKAKNVVIDWNSAIQWILFASNASNTAPRLFAFTHIAMWEAWKVNNASDTPADPSAVTSFAAMLAMKNLVPLYFEKYDELVRQHTANLTIAEISAAENVAKAPVANFLYTRLIDGFQDPNPAPALIGAPGQYVDTGLDTVKPVQQYSHTRPLVLPENLTEVDLIANFTPPPSVDTDAYNNQLNAVYLYGSANSTLRSLSQTNTALFWGDNEASLTTILAQWNRLAIGTIPGNATLMLTIAMLAEYNAGMYDCITSTFYLKYKFFQWRPLTAIRSGDEAHEPDPDWAPLLPTPGYPGYPAFGGCYAGFSEKYLANLYRTDKRTFIVTTSNTDGDDSLLPTRAYSSFSQVASEVTQSRYFAGIEYPVDAASGRILGNTIATYLTEGLTSWDPVYQLPPQSIDMTG